MATPPAGAQQTQPSQPALTFDEISILLVAVVTVFMALAITLLNGDVSPGTMAFYGGTIALTGFRRRAHRKNRNVAQFDAVMIINYTGAVCLLLLNLVGAAADWFQMWMGS